MARRVFSGRGVAIACALAIAVIIPVSALRLIAGPPDEKKVAEQHQQKQDQKAQKSDSEVTVTPELEAIEDYLLTKLGKYDKRADKYARQPRNGKEWYERAYDLYRSERYEESAVAFRRAADEGYREDTSLYNAACSYALLGDANRAIPALGEAIRKGWDDIEHIADDSDFDPIRSDPRFAQVVTSSQRDLITRRVEETERRYNALREGVAGGVAGGVDGGVSGGVSGGVDAGAKGGVKDKTAFKLKVDNDGNFDFDFGGDVDVNDDWFDVGLDLLRLRKIDQSIDAFQRSIAAKEKIDTSMYNIACAYSLKGDARNGMLWLDKAIDNGFSGRDKMSNDPDIALLRQQSGFDDLRRKAKDLELRGCCETGNKWINSILDDNWQEVADHHREIANRYPTSGRGWFNLGYASIKAKDYVTAHSAFRRAIELGYRPGTSTYNVACTYALQHDRENAFAWLIRAETAGFDLENIDNDDDLDSLHRDPRWDKLVARVEDDN